MKPALTMTLTALLACSVAHAADPKSPVPTGIPNAAFSGKVVETMVSGGYTYALLDTGKEKKWVATFEFEVHTSDVANVESAYEMTGFSSPTLNRTFDHIFFASALTVGTNSANVVHGIPQGHHGTEGTEAKESANEAPAELIPGTVIETMNAGGYTYVRVKSTNETIWAATTRMEIKNGDRVSVPRGQVMKNFNSPTLKRTFDSIYFVGYIDKEGEKPHAAASASGNPHAGSAAAPVVQLASPIAPPAGGTSIADLFANRKKLAGKDVVLRGQVTKVTLEVLDRNWLHLVDGSGKPGETEITITTSQKADLGDIVTVKGRVALDQDFGYGYSYPVLVEKASVSK